jgi:hypothetical protein
MIRQRALGHDGGNRAFEPSEVLDVYRLAKLVDELDVSVDWLLGRSDMMKLP